jgi:hypothetical protein
MNDRPTLRVIAAERYERPVRFRMPFRFGAVTVTQAPQCFLRVRIKLADGREAEGVAAELLVPKWFDKSPHLSHEDNFEQLRQSLSIARELMLTCDADTAFGLSAAVEAEQHRACEAAGLNGLIASYGLALHERAIIDALGRLLEESVFALVCRNALGLTAATAPDLAAFNLDRFLGALQPADVIHVRHTVGLADTLTDAELRSDSRLDDGLPETLEQAIATYGHRFFKLKLSGHVDADVERLIAITQVLNENAPGFRATLDGNEQFAGADAVIDLWNRIKREPRLETLRAGLLFIEQPIARAQALSKPVTALAQEVALEIDESDADMDAFIRARELGYTGISSKSCKGFYRSLLNRARVEVWNSEAGAPRYFMSGEDLTTQGGAAVQQDLALASLIGIEHIERNGHHYVDGMPGASEAEQEDFLRAHPQLYKRSGGTLRLDIRQGMLQLGSLADMDGLAVGVMPDFGTMQAMTA